MSPEFKCMSPEFKGSEQRELRRAFAKWLSRILLPRLAKKAHATPEDIPEMNDLREVYTMLAETAEGWTREWLREGEQKGEAKLLLRQLARRISSDLPEWVYKKVNVADMDTLEIWGDQVLDARSLEDVFGPNPVH